MPNAEGITAITAWMISCIFCVFCALMCYAYLLWRLRPSIIKVLLNNRYEKVPFFGKQFLFMRNLHYCKVPQDRNLVPFQ